MKKRILIAVIAVMMSVGFVHAAGTSTTLKNVNVKINDVILEIAKNDTQAVILNGRTMLPIRAVAEALDAAVIWDETTNTAKIYKPDVNMIFVGDIDTSSGNWNITDAACSVNSIGKDKYVNLFITVGPMDGKEYEYRVVIEDPEGKTLDASTPDSFNIDSRGMMTSAEIYGLTYENPGHYAAKFQMKFNGKYYTVKTVKYLVE